MYCVYVVIMYKACYSLTCEAAIDKDNDSDRRQSLQECTAEGVCTDSQRSAFHWCLSEKRNAIIKN